MQTGRDGGPPYHCPLPQMQQLFSPEHWRWPEAAALELPRPNGNCELGHVLQRSS